MEGILCALNISCLEDLYLRSIFPNWILQDFFKVLSRVKQIHEDVKILLRTNQQTAGWV